MDTRKYKMPNCYKADKCNCDMKMKPMAMPMDQKMKPMMMPMNEKMKPMMMPMNEKMKPMGMPMDQKMKPMAMPMHEMMKPMMMPMEQKMKPMMMPMQQEMMHMMPMQDGMMHMHKMPECMEMPKYSTKMHHQKCGCADTLPMLKDKILNQMIMNDMMPMENMCYQQIYMAYPYMNANREE